MLTAYQRILPDALGAAGAGWVALFVAYFAVAHVAARWTGLSGLGALGLERRPGWRRQLLTGLAIGAGAWLLLTLAQVAAGVLRFEAWNAPALMAWNLTQALVVAVLGSAANDVLVRGFIFAHLRNRLPIVAVLLVSTWLYVADDFVIGGFTLRNAAFSTILGLAFGLTVVRYGTLWMNIGLHAGLNAVYWSTWGFGEGRVRSGVARLVVQPGPAWVRHAGIAAALLLLAATAWIGRASDGERDVGSLGLSRRRALRRSPPTPPPHESPCTPDRCCG